MANGYYLHVIKIFISQEQCHNQVILANPLRYNWHLNRTSSHLWHQWPLYYRWKWFSIDNCGTHGRWIGYGISGGYFIDWKPPTRVRSSLAFWRKFGEFSWKFCWFLYGTGVHWAQMTCESVTMIVSALIHSWRAPHKPFCSHKEKNKNRTSKNVITITRQQQRLKIHVFKLQKKANNRETRTAFQKSTFSSLKDKHSIRKRVNNHETTIALGMHICIIKTQAKPPKTW